MRGLNSLLILFWRQRLNGLMITGVGIGDEQNKKKNSTTSPKKKKHELIDFTLEVGSGVQSKRNVAKELTYNKNTQFDAKFPEFH